MKYHVTIRTPTGATFELDIDLDPAVGIIPLVKTIKSDGGLMTTALFVAFDKIESITAELLDDSAPMALQHVETIQ